MRRKEKSNIMINIVIKLYDKTNGFCRSTTFRLATIQSKILFIICFPRKKNLQTEKSRFNTRL